LEFKYAITWNIRANKQLADSRRRISVENVDERREVVTGSEQFADGNE
jgi:hypothetical protein